MAVRSIFTKEEIAEFKKLHDPNLVDALLTNIGDYDFPSVFKNSINMMIEQINEVNPFNEVALERKKQEVKLIEHEVKMFEEFSNLITKISKRYSEITGVSV